MAKGSYKGKHYSNYSNNREAIIERAKDIARAIIDNNLTVRKAAKIFDVSKSTVHKDVTQRLMYIDKKLYDEANAVLQKNKQERHIRGGLATKNMYLNRNNY